MGYNNNNNNNVIKTKRKIRKNIDVMRQYLTVSVKKIKIKIGVLFIYLFEETEEKEEKNRPCKGPTQEHMFTDQILRFLFTTNVALSIATSYFQHRKCKK